MAQLPTPRSAEGVNLGAFSPLDWLTLVAISATWGSSYLLIEIALRGFEPGVIVLCRVTIGAAVLALLPASRRPVDRADARRIVTVAFLWLAVPLLLFAYAQIWVSSSLTGVMNAPAPLLAATVSAVLLRRLPGVPQRIGLCVGLAGTLLISVPGGFSTGGGVALGLSLLVIAELFYAFAPALIAPLQHKYGALALVLRVELVSIVIALPFAIAGLPSSEFRWDSAVAALILGALNTGFGFFLMSTFVGRVGPIRGPVVSYTIPVLALILGAVVLDEHIAVTTVIGLGIVLVATWLIGRSERRAVDVPGDPGETPDSKRP